MRFLMFQMGALAVLGMADAACSRGHPARDQRDSGSRVPETRVAAAARKVRRQAERRPKTRAELWRESLESFAELLAECDKAYFSKVRGERIKKWELPVDVMSMERRCNRLLKDFRDLLRVGSGTAEKVDDFLIKAAKVADYYLILALRARNISVRDRIAYIARVNHLRDRLRRHVAEVREEARSLSGRTGAVVDRMAAQTKEDVETRLINLGKLVEGTIQEALVQPLKESQPVHGYSLRALRQIVSAWVAAYERKGGGALQKAYGHLSNRLAEAENFFAGGKYLDSEPRLRRKILRHLHAALAETRLAASRLRHRHK